MSEGIKPKYSAGLSFEDGYLSINVSGYGDDDGGGLIAFNEDTLEWEDHEEDSGASRFQRIAKSELIAIRDFLIKHFPTTDSHPSAIREAVEGCADMVVVSGELPATLGNAVSDAIFEAIKRGMEVDEAVSVVVAVASDYGCNAYGEAYRRRLAELVRAHRARGEEKGNG